MAEATRFPLDFDALNKGDTITAKTLTDILGVRPSSARYRAKQVDLAFEIERQLKARDRDVTARLDHDDIIIVTDQDAIAYHAKLGKKAVRQLKRALRKSLEIDRGNVDPDGLKALDRSTETLSKRVLAISVAHKIDPQVYQRNVPRMFEPLPAELPAPEAAVGG
jgi:hypothetical protein